MTRSLTRNAVPAKWHFRDSLLDFPYWSRRLTEDEFAGHHFVINSPARAETPIEAFEIRGETGTELAGVVWSTPNGNLLRHSRRSNRFVWSAVDWRFEIHRQYRPGWDTRVLRDWHTKDRVVQALLEAETRWRRDLAQRDAEALADFYV